ncbi:MAG: T9SS type A sorting domain-containing protein [candidate division Zixibacteria bacterium]|nr:T9SS type A sorting domain-containing protein [candidate division Zixibacteria bacterium]
MRYLLYTFIFIMLPHIALAQDTLWTKTFGGLTVSAGHVVIQTSDGGYLAAGMISAPSGEHYDCYLVKTDPSGQLQWERKQGGESDEYVTDIHETSDGYIYCGFTNSFGAGGQDVYLVKVDSVGNPIWSRTYGGTGSELAASMQPTDDGGYILAGRTQGTFGPAIKILAIKTDSQGETEWLETYGANISIASSIKKVENNGYIIAGYRNADSYLIRISNEGDLLWSRAYGGSGAENAEDIEVIPDEGFIFTGWTDSYGAGSYDCFLTKTDFSGEVIWSKTYGGESWDDAFSVAKSDDGGYVMTGWTQSFGARFFDIYIIRVNFMGDTVWTRKYGLDGQDESYSIQQTYDSGYIVTGILDNEFANMWLIKLYGEQSNQLTINMIPENPPIVVPAGSSFTYTGEITNNTDLNLTTDIWIVADVPEYGYFGPVYRISNLALQPFETLTQISNAQEVPMDAPLGSYEYIAFCGDYPNLITDSSYFNFVVTPPNSNGYQNWAVKNRLKTSSNQPKGKGPESVSISPNPFNTSTRIELISESSEFTEITIVNIHGKKVDVLHKGFIPPGNHVINWNASKFSSGIYFLRIRNAERTISKKILLIK